LPRDREVVVFARVNANARVQEPFDVKISHLETYIGKGAARLTPAKASANTAAPTVRA
jgi:hypothetical protein